MRVYEKSPVCPYASSIIEFDGGPEWLTDPGSNNDRC